MKIPGFTAEASLYNMSGHHQVGRRAINSPRRQIINAVQPALQREERIEVFDCGPGFIGIGEGANLECFPNPLTEPSLPREPREPREHREPREPRGPRITSRPGRPWPEETPGPRRRPTCGASLQQEWYNRMTECFHIMKTDYGAYGECLQRNGCPDVKDPKPKSCLDQCPIEDYRYEPLENWQKEACQKGVNEMYEFSDCEMPKDLQDEFIGRWASTHPVNDTIAARGPVKDLSSRPRIAIQ